MYLENREKKYTEEELELYAINESLVRTDVTHIDSKCDPQKYYPERGKKKYLLRDILKKIKKGERRFNILSYQIEGKGDGDRKLKYQYNKLFEKKYPTVAYCHHIFYMENEEYFKKDSDWGYKDVMSFVNALSKHLFIELYNKGSYKMPKSLGTLSIKRDERKYHEDCDRFLETSIRVSYRSSNHTPTLFSVCKAYLRKQAKLLHTKAVADTYDLW